MQGQIDPLSQLLGGLSAQVQALASQLIDLRSEIVTNRQVNQSRWDELTKQLDAVKAEYRNVKHMEREIEQERIALKRLLDSINARIAAVEKVILVWRVRVSMLLSIGVAIGVGVGFLIRTGTEAAIRYWMG